MSVALLRWGINEISSMENWGQGITIKENMKMFQEHSKLYPVINRVGMWMSDKLSIMSLVCIEIE
jgi:hypothetical protein